MEPDAERLAVAVQAADPDSTLSFFRRLVHYRNGSDALALGAYHPHEAAEDVFAYVRAHEGERLLVALNFASEQRPLGLAAVDDVVVGRLELSTHGERPPGAVELRALVLWPDEGVVLRLS